MRQNKLQTHHLQLQKLNYKKNMFLDYLPVGSAKIKRDKSINIKG